jgi:hypothetical protein
MLQQQVQTNPNDHITALKLVKKLEDLKKGGRKMPKMRSQGVPLANRARVNVRSCECKEEIWALWLADWQGKVRRARGTVCVNLAVSAKI